MPDIDDIASEQEEFAREQALKLRKPRGPEATGFCHNCGEAVQTGLRWCDKDCKDDWQRIQTRKQP